MQPTVPVVQLGPGRACATRPTTSPSITPQKSGEGEFLVEGLKEGGAPLRHRDRGDALRPAVRPGQADGPGGGRRVRAQPDVLGHARASAHRFASGEPYDLYATVTNTSQSAANLVSVNLDPRGISGAQLLSDPSRSRSRRSPPGQAVDREVPLVAQKTGEVTFSSFTGEAAAGGGIQLTTGIDERGVPLAPNAIVLPKTADALPAALVAAAQRVLGQAFSIATAPAEALPAGVLFVKRQTVIDRGARSRAGRRAHRLRRTARRASIQDLLLDWLGQHVASTPASIRSCGRPRPAPRSSPRSPRSSSPTPRRRHPCLPARVRRRRRSRRAPHVSAAVGSTPGRRGAAADGHARAGRRRRRDRATGTDDRSCRRPRCDLANRAGGRAARRRRHLRGRSLHRRASSRRAAGHLSTSASSCPAPTPGQLIQLRYPGVPLDAGGRARVVIDLPIAGAIRRCAIDRNGDGQFESAGAAAAAADRRGAAAASSRCGSSCRRTASRPGDIRDPATYGLLVGVLFDKPVTAASAELKTNYSIEANAVIGARLQSSGRLVYLYLERPVGGARAALARGLGRHRRSAATSCAPSTTPIAMALSDGARVFGQVRNAGRTRRPGERPEADRLGAAVLVRRVDDPHRRQRQLRLRLRASHRQRRRCTAQHPVTQRDRIADGAHPRPGRAAAAQPDVPGHAARSADACSAADGVTPGPRTSRSRSFPGRCSSAADSRRGPTRSASSRSPTCRSACSRSARPTDRRRSARRPGVLAGGGQTAELDVVLVDAARRRRARSSDGSS